MSFKTLHNDKMRAVAITGRQLVLRRHGLKETIHEPPLSLMAGPPAASQNLILREGGVKQT